MQVPTRITKLFSLLLVFLSENYESRFGHCEICGTPSPSFGKTFLMNSQIGPRWICVECIVNRIEGK